LAGISKNVLKYYADIMPYGKPVVSLPDSLNPDWVSGFVAEMVDFLFMLNLLRMLWLKRLIIEFILLNTVRDFLIYLLSFLGLLIPPPDGDKWYSI
jgi:hypothetical protein